MCQSFILKSKDNQIVVGRTMEFPLFRIMDKPLVTWYVCNVPAGSAFDCSFRQNDKAVGMQCTMDYSYIGLTAFSEEESVAFGKDIYPAKPLKGTYCTEGINEKGISVSALMYDSNMRWSATGTTNVANVLFCTFVEYLLGKYSSLKKLRLDITYNRIGLFAFTGMHAKLNQPAHFIVHDSAGDCLVIEVDNEKITYYDKEHVVANKLDLYAAALNDVLFGHLTNAPSFLWHLNNLRQYLYLSANDPQHPKDSRMVQISHGGGMFGLPGDYTSPSRFIRLSNILRFVPQPKDRDAAILLTNHMLNSMTIIDGTLIEAAPEGAVQPKDLTQWVTIKELHETDPVMHVRTYFAEPLSNCCMYQRFSFTGFPTEISYEELKNENSSGKETKVKNSDTYFAEAEYSN